MPLEEGLTDLSAIDAPYWELGGLELEVSPEGDEGLDDVAEVESEDQDAAGDGTISGTQRLASRPISLTVRVSAPDGYASDETADAFAQSLDAIRTVMSPLPDRTATRLLRWKRRGEVAKRIAVRPARGRPLSVPGTIQRISYDTAFVTLRLEAPDPVILSDEYHTVTFTPAETKTINNAGSFTAVHPGAWWLEANNPVTLENTDHSEWVRFPTGPLTVSRRREIAVNGTPTGICYGPNSTYFPRWPLLRPGDNAIKASAACTLNWRDTW